MITAQQARNNMKFSLENVLDEISSKIEERSRDNFDNVKAYCIPKGLVDDICTKLTGNGFEIIRHGEQRLEIRWG